MATLLTLEKKIDSLAQSIEDLAIITKQGFDQCATKDELREIEYRLDRIENISIGSHERRIENLEDKVLVISTKMGLKKN